MSGTGGGFFNGVQVCAMADEGVKRRAARTKNVTDKRKRKDLFTGAEGISNAAILCGAFNCSLLLRRRFSLMADGTHRSIFRKTLLEIECASDPEKRCACVTYPSSNCKDQIRMRSFRTISTKARARLTKGDDAGSLLSARRDGGAVPGGVRRDCR